MHLLSVFGAVFGVFGARDFGVVDDRVGCVRAVNGGCRRGACVDRVVGVVFGPVRALAGVFVGACSAWFGCGAFDGVGSVRVCCVERVVFSGRGVRCGAPGCVCFYR